MSTAPHALSRLLGSLDPATRDRLADAYAARARALGLLYLGGEGSRPIPVVFPPRIEDRASTISRAKIAHSITAAVAAACRALLDGALGSSLADELLSELSPLERELVAAQYRDLDKLATVRADLIPSPGGPDRLLELNTTIPAMQAYSDIAARAFVEACLEVLGNRAPEAAAPILEANGSNAEELLGSLLACYRADGGVGERPSIALVHRPGDSQLSELQYLAARFRELGHEARPVEVGRIRLGDDGRALIDGADERPEILYRHVFASRVDPRSDFAAILRSPDGHFLYNRVAPHLEQKSILAEVSAAAVDPGRVSRLGITSDQSALLRRHLPWTRRLRPGPCTDPSGQAIPDLPDFVVRGQAGLVLKRSWDFGGKGVFLGADYDDPEARARAAARLSPLGPLTSSLDPSGGPPATPGWARLVDACLQEGGWVVQERVPLEVRPAVIARGAGALKEEVFIDVSSFTNLGTEPGLSPVGGVCRASRSAIVNIQSGGGVVPLLAAEAADRLVTTLMG